MLFELITASVILWLAIGAWGVGWHWHRDFGDYQGCAWFAAILGPLTWPVGFYVHRGN